MDSNDATDSAGRDDEDPLERVREIFAERAPRPVTEPASLLDLTDASRINKFYLGLAVGVALALLLPGVIVAVEETATETLASPPTAASGDRTETLYLSVDDAEYMSRVFRETTHEVAYCGRILDDNDRPRLEIWLADIVNAGPERVEFIAATCPDATREVLIHTHPNGVLRLSDKDRSTLIARPEEFMCVQGGEFEARPGAPARHFACYRLVRSESPYPHVAQIPVKFTS